jgi:glutaredoxin
MSARTMEYEVVLDMSNFEPEIDALRNPNLDIISINNHISYLQTEWRYTIMRAQQAFQDRMACPFCHERPETIAENDVQTHVYSTDLQEKYQALIRSMKSLNPLFLSQDVLDKVKKEFLELEEEYMAENEGAVCEGLLGDCIEYDENGDVIGDDVYGDEDEGVGLDGDE